MGLRIISVFIVVAPLKDDFLLLTQASEDGVMYQTSLDGTRVWRLPIYFGYKVVGVDYDPIDHKVYWIDESGVVASTLNGTRTLIHAMPRSKLKLSAQPYGQPNAKYVHFCTCTRYLMCT